MADGLVMNRGTGFVWVVGRREDKGDAPGEWHLQGIMDYEEWAVQACQDETYFVGPLPVNTALPHSRIEWVGSYFPLKQDGGQDDNI